jgi:hypothetical protein
LRNSPQLAGRRFEWHISSATNGRRRHAGRQHLGAGATDESETRDRCGQKYLSKVKHVCFYSPEKLVKLCESVEVLENLEPQLQR